MAMSRPRQSRSPGENQSRQPTFRSEHIPPSPADLVTLESKLPVDLCHPSLRMTMPSDSGFQNITHLISIPL